MSHSGNYRKITALILIINIIMLCFASCDGVTPEQISSEPGTIISETDTEICIVDQAGREVVVSKYPDSIALCYRVVIRFLIALEIGDRITGIGKTEEFLEDIQPSLRDCADVGQGVADIEALAELGPDIFIHKASDVETLEAVEKIGIPSIGIDVETPEDMLTAIKIMGAVCGKTERAEALAGFYENELESLAELTSDITEKKTAIVMGSSIGKIADGSMLQGQMIERAGGINCAAEISGTELWPTAGTEQIFTWNPDYIFISNSQNARYSADNIYSDNAWSELTAVKDKNICLIPSQSDSWEFPGVISLLGIEYMIHVMYPEKLSEEELEKRVDSLYEFMYGKHFDRSYLGY